MDIHLRKRSPEDDQFSYDLFCEHKVKELNAEKWSSEMRSPLLKIQYQAFEASIHNKYPDHEDRIISLKSVAIGRLVLNKSASQIQLIYIAMLSEYQNKGIGKKILKNMIIESNINNIPFSLNVSKNNPAYNLYLKLGFRVMSEDDVNYEMTYNPLTKR